MNDRLLRPTTGNDAAPDSLRERSPGLGASVRLELLRRVEGRLEEWEAATPPYAVVSHRRLPEELSLEELKRRVDDLLPELLRRTRHISSDQILVRLCPLDESVRPDLSFAGVFKAYLPRRDSPRRRHLTHGILQALLGRRSAYADYYFQRHAIEGARSVDLLLSECVQGAAMFGTVYVFEGKVLGEYFDCPLSMLLADPVRFAATRTSALAGLDARIARCALGLHDWLGEPLDIEFIVNRQERLFVTELRPVSAAHRRNWRRLPEEAWARAEAGTPPSNVVNSIGERTGDVVDLRERQTVSADFENPADKIYVVRHQPGGQGTSSFQWLQTAARMGLTDLSVVADHGEAREDNHLQYVMFEDPGISFLVNATDLPRDLPAGRATVKSDGFQASLR